MDQATLRTRLFWVAGAYAAVLSVSAGLILERYLAYVRHPDDVAASGGMWAGGDMLLEVFIAGMVLVVTFFLVLVIANAEVAYATYSKILLALSLTAPIAIGLMAIPAVGQSNSMLGYVCLYRALGSPLVLLGLAMSRLFARFPKPRRITNYALLIEGMTLVFVLLMLFLPFHPHHA
jgi:hypothetical protein